MNSGKKRNLGHSIFQKLLNFSKESRLDFNYVLLRYGVERFLYRLSVSEFSDKFILKGASLFLVWRSGGHRVTKDADLLSFGSPDMSRLREIFKKICGIQCVEDGVVFDPAKVRAFEIREGQIYGGVRISLKGKLDQAIVPVQIDIGFGDSVVPPPERVDYPTLLDIPSPEMKAYTRYSMIAEKLHAMVELGIANSRMKDFFDLWLLSRLFNYDGTILQESVKSTFEARKTKMPSKKPLALTSEFFMDSQKQIQWNAFTRKAKPETAAMNLQATIEKLTGFLMPVLESLRQGEVLEKEWIATSAVWK